MRLPDEIYIVQHEQAHSMAFLDLIDAYAYVNTLKTSNNVRLFTKCKRNSRGLAPPPFFLV